MCPFDILRKITFTNLADRILCWVGAFSLISILLLTCPFTSLQTSERNHAMRTAMLATCEAQLETLQQELRDKDVTSHEAIERVTSLQASLAAAEARLAERVKEATAGTYVGHSYLRVPKLVPILALLSMANL
jgi:hypothetical protein